MSPIPQRPWCFDQCTKVILAGLIQAAGDVLGRPLQDDVFDVEFMCAKPIFMDRWWTSHTCEHGNIYWYRPGAAYRSGRAAPP